MKKQRKNTREVDHAESKKLTSVDDEQRKSISAERGRSLDVIPEGLLDAPPEMVAKQLNEIDGFDR